MPLYLSEEARRTIAGHLWTIAPWLRHRIRPSAAPPSETFRHRAPDAKLGGVMLGGRVRHVPGARGLLVVVHGLGGTSVSHYALTAALAADRAGLSCLRIDLRGASGDGEDFYHAGLHADLASVLGDETLARYERVYALGYSMGGHLALRLAALSPPPRLCAVASICAPLDLDATATALDRPEAWLYRQHVLRGLREMVARVAERRPELVPIGARALASIGRLREWDARVVAPRHGFRSAEDYYAEASVGPHLCAVGIPALLVHAEADPMVPAATVRPALSAASGAVVVRWIDPGGHVGFPAGVDLGAGGGGGGAGGVEEQVIGWLLGQ